MNTIVAFEGVSKKYKKRTVIHRLSFGIKKGDVLGILGPSGRGKSTILKLIAGIEQPTGGRIWNHARRIGYVFQEPRLLPWETALKNIMLPLLALNVSKHEADKQARYYLDKMGLQGFAGYYPSQLSGGMAQRVSLARALAIEPDLLLFDEAFTGLDKELKAVLLSMIREILSHRPVTIVYVSHTPEEMAGLTNRTFRL